VEPDTANVPAGGLPNDMLRNAGVCGDHEAIQFTWYAGKVWKALCALNL
jgi:hypothetical protein